MKWIGRILYVFIVVQLGIIIMQQSTLSKHFKYYEENGIPLLVENKKEEYIQEYFVATSVQQYVTTPLYNAVSNDTDLGFEFSIYNVMHTDKQVIIFYFDDRVNDNKQIDYNKQGFIKNNENYLANKNLVRISVMLYFDNVTEPVNFDYQIFPTNLEQRMPVQTMVISDEGKFIYSEYDNKKKAIDKDTTTLNRIDLVVEDHTEENAINVEKMNTKTLATFIHNKDAVLTPGTNDELIRDGEVMESVNFNGLSSKFDYKDTYKNNKELVTIPNSSGLNAYNSLVTRPLAIYSLVVIVVTYLLFFFKPTFAYFQNRKYKKMREAQIVENVVEEVEKIDPTIYIEPENIEINEPNEDTILIDNEVELEETNNVEYNTMTVAKLKEVAKEKGLTGYTTLRKAELIELLNNNDK